MVNLMIIQKGIGQAQKELKLQQGLKVVNSDDVFEKYLKDESNLILKCNEAKSR